MKNNLYKAMALAGAPFLFIGYSIEMIYPSLVDSWFTGLWGLLYITGWTITMLALKNIQATGSGWFGRGLLKLILVTLCIANISNLFQLIVPHNKPFFFFYIDLCWPMSNLLMLVVGILTIRAGKIKGWRRLIPLIVGLWLPVSIGALIIMGKNNLSMMIGGVYSLVAWIMLALFLMRSPGAFQQTNANFIKLKRI